MAVLEAVGGAFEGDDLGVVDQAVGHGCGDGLVAEDLAPVGAVLFEGDDEAGALVAGGDELEEEVGGSSFEGDVSDLVDHQDRIDGPNRAWVARWWEHDEAVIRFEALRRAREHLCLDAATGMSVWWRDHADYHLSVLMDPARPFGAADVESEANQSKRGAPLPYEGAAWRALP